MNRLGMIVDLTHTSHQTQLDVLAIAGAPVMFSHSNSYTLCPIHRNVHDDVLQLVVSKTSLRLENKYWCDISYIP